MDAIKTGERDEFHFATNGHFTSGFRDAVEAANSKLEGSGNCPISLFEHVIAEGVH